MCCKTHLYLVCHPFQLKVKPLPVLDFKLWIQLLILDPSSPFLFLYLLIFNAILFSSFMKTLVIKALFTITNTACADPTDCITQFSPFSCFKESSATLVAAKGSLKVLLINKHLFFKFLKFILIYNQRYLLNHIF